MALGRINGPMLQPNLERLGVDIAIDGDLTYWDVNNRYVGVRTTTPNYPLEVHGNARVGNVYLLGNSISTDSGILNLGSTANVSISGGGLNYTLTTDGSGNLTWANIATLAASGGLTANTITLGANTTQALVSNAVALTQSTSVTNAIAQLNYILGKLVPPSPPAFPGASAFNLSTATSSARICNFSQTDNSIGNTYQAVAGSTVAAIRTSTYATTTLNAMGPGDSGTVTAYWNGKAAGSVVMAAGVNATNGNLVITNNQDYHNVVSTVTAGFWYSFSAQATGTALPGWNTVLINDTYNSANTNPILFYYDNTTVAGPTFSNVTTAGTNAVLTTNNVSYSSSIPHLTTGSVLRLKGNIANLSGDMYYTSDTFMTGSAGGAWQAPTGVTYTQVIDSSSKAALTTPLSRNLYASSGSGYWETNASLVASGFGSSATGPSMTAFNGYSSATQSFTTALGATVLYKIGTSIQIEETALTIGTVGSGSGAPYRIVLTASTDTPAYTGSETAWNSQTTPLGTYDATVVAGVLKSDVTNYSTGYYPVGPNLSTQNSTQYFTFKFVRTAVSKFDILYTGTLAGLWVALPGQSDSLSTLNGWYDMGTAYAGSGNPGAGAGGNGSNGCALGGVAVFNSAQTNKSVTCTFGGLSSSSSTNNEIYVRVKLTSGQTLTALQIQAATH